VRSTISGSAVNAHAGHDNPQLRLRGNLGLEVLNYICLANPNLDERMLTASCAVVDNMNHGGVAIGAGALSSPFGIHASAQADREDLLWSPAHARETLQPRLAVGDTARRRLLVPGGSLRGTATGEVYSLAGPFPVQINLASSSSSLPRPPQARQCPKCALSLSMAVQLGVFRLRLGTRSADDLTVRCGTKKRC
jgi:hypothetical protein